MAECLHCGKSITRSGDGIWIHEATGRGVCSWAEPNHQPTEPESP